MSEYEYSVTIHSDADTVFDFVSDVRNMPKYMPTLDSAETEGPEKVHMHGEVRGHEYDADGELHIDKAARKLQWRSDSRSHYTGWLEVKPSGADSQVTVHVSFEPKPGEQAKYDESGGEDRVIQDVLEKTLMSIQNILENKGGKVEPRAA